MSFNAEIVIFTDSNGALGFGRYAGAYRIASELRSRNHTVQVVDFFAEYSLDELKQIVDRYVGDKTLWVGFSTTLFAPGVTSEKIKNLIQQGTYNNSFMIENWKSGVFPQSDGFLRDLASYIRERGRNVKLVVGGSKAVRESPFLVDYYLWGEADYSCVALTDYLKGNRSSLKSDKFMNACRVLGDSYPVNDFQNKTIDWCDQDHVFEGEHLPIELSRGCAFRCAYCSFKNLGRHDDSYLKKLDVFRREVTRNNELFGTTGYMFSDDTFNDSLEKVDGYAEVIQSLPFRLTWAGYCRLDMFHRKPGMLESLRHTNPEFINFGIETFHPKAGRAVGKGLDPGLVKEQLHRVKEVLGPKTIVSCNFIVGLRHEPEESIWKTLEWLLSEDCPVDAFNFTPLYVIHYRRDVLDKTSDFSNAIGNSPQKFGYDYDPESGAWSHEHMTSSRAHEIVNEIYLKQGAREKTLANRIGFFGRLKNLGFEMSDLISGTAREDDSLVLSLVERKLELKRQYLNKLLKEPVQSVSQPISNPLAEQL